MNILYFLKLDNEQCCIIKCKFYTPSPRPCPTVIEEGSLRPIRTAPKAVIGTIPRRSSPAAIFVVIIAKPCHEQIKSLSLMYSLVFFSSDDKVI